ncbi:class I SAM-dependent methyltransferase [Sulfuricystis multivorans]|uniref:class I SAM-dependent methyltransferase n=1 Tax=Sulfuricystis multivorans TaxID=2211108 RepID=UPI000F81E3E3|nr:class I SAM-dependent methyltransferase [Sulfuricystis multivorans]
MSAAELRQEHIAFQANLYESNNPTRRWLHNVRRDWVIQALDHVTPSQAHFLEIGIGCGIYTHLMASRGKVFAIDINSAFVEAANQIPNVVAQVSDITIDRFDPVHDVALCSEVLEHVRDSASALKNIYASLKPGGYLVLTTPNSYSTVELTARLLSFGLVVKLARLIYGESVDDLGHINRMTRSQLRTQIDAAGFEVVRQENIAFYLPVIAEFCGDLGVRICQWFARRLAGSRLAPLLWTQCWVLRRPKP